MGCVKAATAAFRASVTRRDVRRASSRWVKFRIIQRSEIQRSYELFLSLTFKTIQEQFRILISSQFLNYS
jgi:hypothetical protein